MFYCCYYLPSAELFRSEKKIPVYPGTVRDQAAEK